MYDKVLDTFIAVVNEESFSKAASNLFMSAVSVMKQMNNFENQLGFKVFKRTTRGVKLTPAGQALYESAQKIINESHEAIEHARSLAQNEQITVRIATSLLRSAQPILNAWEKMSDKDNQVQIQIVPFNDDANSLRQVTNQLGKTVDLIVGPTNSTYLMDNEFDFFNLGDQKCDIMVPRQNKLASKESLTWEDLNGQTILLLRPGLSPKIDELRNDIIKNHPQIKIVDTNYFYDINVFNYCANHNYLMEALSLWNNVHPSMISKLMSWNYAISYGILSSSHAKKEIKEFISTVGQEYLKSKDSK